MNNGGYAEIAHTADLALKVWGNDFYALIKYAAKGMYNLMEVEYVETTKKEIDFTLPLSDRENILVDFLNELLYLCEEKEIYLSAFSSKISDDHIQISAGAHEIQKLRRQIKAVTYHALEIIETEKGFETILTFDV